MTKPFKPEGWILISSLQENNNQLKKLAKIMDKSSMSEALTAIMSSISKNEILKYIVDNVEFTTRRRGVTHPVKAINISVSATTVYQLKDLQQYIRNEHKVVSLALLVSCILKIYRANLQTIIDF